MVDDLEGRNGSRSESCPVKLQGWHVGRDGGYQEQRARAVEEFQFQAGGPVCQALAPVEGEALVWFPREQKGIAIISAREAEDAGRSHVGDDLAAQNGAFDAGGDQLSAVVSDAVE